LKLILIRCIWQSLYQVKILKIWSEKTFKSNENTAILNANEALMEKQEKIRCKTKTKVDKFNSINNHIKYGWLLQSKGKDYLYF
jgi:hypothetical protein